MPEALYRSRGPTPASELRQIPLDAHESIQGTHYTSIVFGLSCKEVGVRRSMGSLEDAYDYGLCESFFATLQWELLEPQQFPTQANSRMTIFDSVEGFYDPRRRHSALGKESPINFERRAQAVA